MTDSKRLAFSIIRYLHEQLQSGNLSSGAQESLEVAVQCLETAFEVSADDRSLDVPLALPEIFASATLQTSSWENNNDATVGEGQRGEAERLKADGNDQMKVDNYAAAVEFYSKAIALNPHSAVYYCNRAAALSKQGNYAGAVQDCERAIGIDPNYSKAYGRMGLALASLNKHSEAITFYKKALELDPDNDTYKSNLKIAEEKMDATSPANIAGMGGVDLAGLLSNPGFMNMASSLMTNPQVQQMMSGMMSGAYGGGGGAAGGGGGVPGGAPGPAPVGDLSGLIQAGQQFAQQMQQQNPELIEELRSQIRNRTPSAGNEEQP
ncbi:small glutamine-rich tetratricopeptide repeat-containing protein alpha isoform X1 [Syngnathus scovelli]|uniref:small glutamine-rich tetratricopeptide repeat-containing protein alpha isoform X1 n=1 Tax=Syngnathus scovelli TaxID=161590 RepID=UPI002110D406|nr:small glutamine-rich tetratricopeptide repeat-containing protein alpha isoform X1 [Syngnathus scovelli]XP_049587201.1 small glutamine-rich tetratricopeptide repeat-containing protein alpha isoform X1 [Syngnathus scovelli]XP_049587210.1 small glutamine-rich tetratricopeptide repeat-containing protein alpha isoform X1 [Syngnathus scovelli]XP_049587219.1 small glutamine-rich tetratricopeptide repeat-containing protein alpha isoform X1 [Syngnathus scovelli]